MDPLMILSLLAMGAFGGFAAGLLGIGGGMILVPFMTMIFTALDFPPAHIVHMAIATCLATILFTSISSVRAHHLRGAVRWDIVRLFTPGILAGLVGAGGGFVSIPFMTWYSVRIHNAVATSAALGFPIALAGTLANIWFGMGEALPAHSLGFIYLPALAIISTASVLMAPLGARTAHKWPVQRLRRVFAYILYALALYMLWKGVVLAGVWRR